MCDKTSNEGNDDLIQTTMWLPHSANNKIPCIFTVLSLSFFSKNIPCLFPAKILNIPPTATSSCMYYYQSNLLSKLHSITSYSPIKMRVQQHPTKPKYIVKSLFNDQNTLWNGLTDQLMSAFLESPSYGRNCTIINSKPTSISLIRHQIYFS